jgi:hypothetical protein
MSRHFKGKEPLTAERVESVVIAIQGALDAVPPPVPVVVNARTKTQLHADISLLFDDEKLGHPALLRKALADEQWFEFVASETFPKITRAAMQLLVDGYDGKVTSSV